MDKETIIKGCENWVNNHKGENFLLTYSSVVELLALLKEQEEEIENLKQTAQSMMEGIVVSQPQIVRCKDCKHFVHARTDAIGHCTKDISCWVFRDMDWFCANGKRKDNE